MNTISRSVVWWIVGGCWLVAGPAFAQSKPQLPAGVEYVTTVEGITEYRLTNGLAVLLFPDPSQPVITVNVTYKVGSRHEGYGETGMAHLLEHLLFKGSKNHPNIPQELSSRGARPNGNTWVDRTCYFETFDATDDNLRWALDLESDRMVNSFIARKDLESEFSVVRNEYESGENNPVGVLYKRMIGTVFHWHNYGNVTIGEKSDIEGAPIERLQAFYRTYYQPDNAVLIVAGKLDEPKTLAVVAEIFGKVPKPTRVLIPTYTNEPTQDGEREITLRRTGDVQVFGCMYRSVAAGHPDHAPLVVLENLLTDEPTGRLYKALVEAKKAASISGDVTGMAEAGLVTFSAEVRQEQSLAAAQTAMLATLDDLKTNPPTADEVAKAKTRLLKDFEMFLKRSDRVGLGLSNYIGQGDWRLAFLYRDQVEKVTPDDLRRVAQYYFKPANRTLGRFLPDPKPDRAEIPAAPDLTALLKDYKGKAALAQGEDFDPAPANIESRTTRGKLAAGLQYALLPKKNRGNAVTAAFTFRFGTRASLQQQQVVGRLTAELLDKGTQAKTRQQINDLQDQLKARIHIGGDVASANVNLETDREHLAAVIRLVGEILRQPAFPANEFEKLREETLSAIDQHKTDPGALADNAFQRLTNPYPAGDPRYTMTFAEQIAAVKAVTVEQVRAFHQQFYGSTAATAAIVGDFDRAEIETVLRETFGDWKSPAPFERIANPYVAVAPGTTVIPTPDKANAHLTAGFGYAMRNDHPDYPALAISGYAIGGGFLNSRLATRIRQKDGLSYGVGGRFFASALDENGGFHASAIYNPVNVTKLEQAFREEIERAASAGLTADELTMARSGWLKSRKLNRTNDSGLAGALNQYLFLGRTLNWDADFESRVEKLTLADVNRVLQQYLDYRKLIIVKAGDFKNPPPAK